MVEPKLLLELLVCLFTNPSCFDGSGEHRDSGIGRQVRYIVFLLSGRPPFADEPDLIAGHALHTIIEHAVLMAIRKSDTAGGEENMSADLGCLDAKLIPFATSLRPTSPSAETGDRSGMWYLRRFPVFARGKIRATSAG